MGGRLGEIALSFKPKDDGLSLEKIVDMVDQSFEKGFGIKIRVLYLRFWFSGIAIVTFILAYYLSQVAVNAATANLLELSISIDAEATAIAAFGLVMFGLVLSRDWADSEERRAERLHFLKLKDQGDPITFRALIRMRASLPKGIPLKHVYAASPELFTEKEFVRRLLQDP